MHERIALAFSVSFGAAAIVNTHGTLSKSIDVDASRLGPKSFVSVSLCRPFTLTLKRYVTPVKLMLMHRKCVAARRLHIRTVIKDGFLFQEPHKAAYVVHIELFAHISNSQ